eukprot:gene15324-biopygen1112
MSLSNPRSRPGLTDDTSRTVHSGGNGKDGRHGRQRGRLTKGMGTDSIHSGFANKSNGTERWLAIHLTLRLRAFSEEGPRVSKGISRECVDAAECLVAMLGISIG